MLSLIVEMRQHALETLVRDDWCVELAARGMNGLVFRATHADGRDYAVKVTRRDHRQRAQREFTALTLMQDSGITARPIAVHPDVPDLPDSSVIVSEWIDANPYKPPDSLTGHLRIQQALTVAHQMTTAPLTVMQAALFVQHPADILADLERRYALLPHDYPYLRTLINRAVKFTSPYWAVAPRLGLVQCDAWPANVLDNGQRLYLVDWENSGWGDPAFEVADMAAKPGFGSDLGEDDFRQAAGEHGERLHDPTLPQRARVYRQLMVVWWAIRLTAYRDAPDQRVAGVVQPNFDYLERMQAQYVEWALMG